MILNNPATYYGLCAASVVVLGVVCYRAVTRDTERSRVALDLFYGVVPLAYGLSSLDRLGALPIRGRAYGVLSLALWALIAGLLVVLVGRRVDTDS
jgi:hypothetical protein